MDAPSDALAGYHICFSGFPIDSDSEDEAEMMNCRGVAQPQEPVSLRALTVLAQSLGAVPQLHITKRTTVLVARQGLTRKRLVAEQHRIPVVGTRWLFAYGRIPFAAAPVAPLAGYTFCATQMAAAEETALATIVEEHGGVFSRTLTTQTSLLFIPPGWLKEWRNRQQQLQRHIPQREGEEERGRPSTGVAGTVPLPEKIRFAWTAEIPVVEYTRFLTMAALHSSERNHSTNNNDNNNNNGNKNLQSSKSNSHSHMDSAGRRADFDTIAQLCAVPPSTICGSVPHSQCLEQMLEPAIEKKEDEDEDEEKEEMKAKRSKDGVSIQLSRKRPRVQTSSDDEEAVPQPRQKEDTPQAEPSSCNRHETEVKAKGTKAVNLTNSSLMSTTSSGFASLGMHFFTHSIPFLQLSLVGCTPRELLECTRMSVQCRFLRTPMVTPFTDVVVVGSEPDAVRLGQLRDELASTCGVALERIVGVAWLRACYDRMMMMQQTPSGVFCPGPLPSNQIPSTKSFQICIPATASDIFNATKQRDSQPPRQQESISVHSSDHLPYPQSGVRAADSLQKDKHRTPHVMSKPPLPRRSTGNPKAKVDRNQDHHAAYTDNDKGSDQKKKEEEVDREEEEEEEEEDETVRRYKAEVRLADRRVRDLLPLFRPPLEERNNPLNTCLFCFIDGEFSRVELAIVRALIRHGGGAWVKQTRDVWVRFLARREGNDSGDNEESVHMALARRRSVQRRRFIRAQPHGQRTELDAHIMNDGVKGEEYAQQHQQWGQTVVLRVIPHGDQQPLESLLLQPSAAGAMGVTTGMNVNSNPAVSVSTSLRHPLRYLPAVTQDYVLCSLAANRPLHPRGCFLFTCSTPTEVQRAARRRRRVESGKPLALSPWIGPRRNEKAPLVGVSVYFLRAYSYPMDAITERESTSDEASLWRVLANSLTALVSELGGHATETLLREAVTHVVFVDVASLFSEGFDARVATTLPTSNYNEHDNNNFNSHNENEEDAACDALLKSGVGNGSQAPISRFISSEMQSRFPPGLLKDTAKWAASGSLTLVNLDWLHASAAWGVFVDETPFVHSVTLSMHHPTATPSPPSLSPQPGRVEDATLLPFESVMSFDFTTPMATPHRHSRPRSTLRTPRRQGISVPRVTSPAPMRQLQSHPASAVASAKVSPSPSATVMVAAKATTTTTTTAAAAAAAVTLTPTSNARTATPTLRKETPPHTPVEVENQSDSDVDEPNIIHASPTLMPQACTPVGRRTKILAESDRESVTCDTQSRSRASIPCIPAWDPGVSHSSNRPRNSQHGRRSSIGDLDSQKDKVLPWRTASNATRVHILHDVPDREALASACARLCSTTSVSSSSATIIIGGGNLSSDNGEASIWQPELHRPRNVEEESTPSSAFVVQFNTPSVRDADILVAHHLTQRESVLAAIAAGLWVVTPRVLQDCRTKQCLLPLRDLAVYEWCPELLPPGAAQSSVGLAKQCRRRRQKRQAGGGRLFDGQCFILFATHSGVGRLRSLRAIIEIGGGYVMGLIIYKCNTSSGGNVGNGNEDTLADAVVVDSSTAMTEYVATQIAGNNGEVKCGEMKELFLLADVTAREGEAALATSGNRNDGHSTGGPSMRDISAALRGATSQFTDAKHVARERLQQQEERQQRQPFCVPWTKEAGGGVFRGMPQLDVVRLFTSDWVTLTIQQRRKAPACVVELQ